MATRAALLAFLAARYTDLLRPLGVAATDSADGLGDPLDAALAALGYPGDTSTLDLATGATVQARALAAYYTLDLLHTKAASRTDRPEPQGAGAADPGWQPRPAAQLFRQIGTLRDEAATRCKALGVAVDGVAAPAHLIRLNLDFLAPRTGLRRDGWGE